jgi:hypothetical protein
MHLPQLQNVDWISFLVILATWCQAIWCLWKGYLLLKGYLLRLLQLQDQPQNHEIHVDPIDYLYPFAFTLALLFYFCNGYWRDAFDIIFEEYYRNTHNTPMCIRHGEVCVLGI